MQDHEPSPSKASKEGASWKILIGLGVVLALVIAGSLVNAIWITPGERRVARQALSIIDDLDEMPNAGNLDPRLESEIERPAREALQSAQQAAWTHRDVKISWELQAYFLGVEQERTAKQLTGVIPEVNTAPRSTEKCAAVKSGETIAFCILLHRALD